MMKRLFWVLALLSIFLKPSHGCYLEPLAPEISFTDASIIELRHQLGPEVKITIFSLSDPLPEARVEILNFFQPDSDNAAPKTIKEMIWHQGQGYLVIWLHQEGETWRAFHHNVICPH